MTHDFDYYLGKVFNDKFNEWMEKICMAAVAVSLVGLVYAAIFVW